MSQPRAQYRGEDITCYPGSNQTDDGKLQLEFNMSRLVTRLSSKNFCIKYPSFIITQIEEENTGNKKLEISDGEASINGMDLIMKNPLQIDPPDDVGEYYLAFRLARDSSWNVLGDSIYGVSTTFEGLYLTYYNDKPEVIDADYFYIGKVNWNGIEFTSIIEDEDKYGRIWAKDILCKIEDPKHPDVSRLLLQDWIYNVPDWYVSKEGDIEYGAIEFLPGREGVTDYGVKIQAIDDDNSAILIKAPSIDGSDANKVGKWESNDEGTAITLGQGSIFVNSVDNYKLNILHPTEIKVHSYTDLKLQGDLGVFIGTGGNGDGPELRLRGHRSTLSDVLSTDLVNEIQFINEDNIKHKFGKAIWQYNDLNSSLNLLSTDLTALNINPNTNFSNDARVEKVLRLGVSDALPQTTLERSSWWLRQNTNNGKTINFLPDSIILTNPSLSTSDNSSIILKNTSDSIHTKILDDAEIELLNNTRNPNILFKDGNQLYDVYLEKIIGQNKLNISGNLQLINLVASGALTGNGLITSNGVLTFKRGTSDATIIKDNNLANLRTNSNLYIGPSGTSGLFAGNTVINGSFGIGASTYASSKLKVDTDGNLVTSGTITGTKVYNAVYNGFGEIFRKDKDEIIEYGDIVCIRDDGLVHKVSNFYDLQTIIGICSDTIGVEMGGKDIPKEEQLEVEMVGQIWVKTNNPDITPGKMVKALPDGTVDLSEDRSEKFGITITKVIDGKVQIVYNG